VQKVKALKLFPNTQFEFGNLTALSEQDLEKEESRNEIKTLKLNTSYFFEYLGSSFMDMQTEDSNRPVPSNIDLIQVM